MSHQKITPEFLVLSLCQYTAAILFGQGIHPVSIALVELQLQNGPGGFRSEPRTVCLQNTTKDRRATPFSTNSLYAHTHLPRN
jgi:hypothetical protein